MTEIYLVPGGSSLLESALIVPGTFVVPGGSSLQDFVIVGELSMDKLCCGFEYQK